MIVVHYVASVHFNPRSPCGERRVLAGDVADAVRISTHAPRAGSDLTAAALHGQYQDFNPRSPCGERPPKLKTIPGGE